MSTINKVIVLGNVGKDPDIRTFQDGSKVANFSMATSDVWTDRKTGERKEKTEWHKITVINEKIVDVIAKYVRKGSKILIEGQLHTRKWDDGSGLERTVTEIVIGKYKGELVLLDARDRVDLPLNNTKFAKTPNLLNDEIPF